MSSLKLFRWLFSVASFYFSFIHLYIFVFVVHWTTTSTTATKTKTFKNNNKTEQNEVEKHHALYLSVPLTGNESTRCFARTLLSNSFALISFHFMVLLYCISVWFFFSFHPPSRRSFTHHSFTLNSHNISWNFILAFCVSLSPCLDRFLLSYYVLFACLTSSYSLLFLFSVLLFLCLWKSIYSIRLIPIWLEWFFFVLSIWWKFVTFNAENILVPFMFNEA